MSTIQDAALDRIRKQGRGKVFIPKDFLDVGSVQHTTDRSCGKGVSERQVGQRRHEPS